MIGIVAFFVIYSCASIENFYGPKSTWLINLGGASYSLYLIQPVIAAVVPSILEVFNLKLANFSVVFSVIFAIVVGTTFYKYGEMPLTQFLSGRAKKRKLI